MFRDIWIVMLVCSFLCFFTGLVLVFVWKIPDTIDELSGRKAKRQIKMMHELNSSTGAFDNMSTKEIYSSIPSGSLVDNESMGIMDSELEDTSDMFFNDIEDNNEDSATSIMDTTESETSVIEDEVGTELMDDNSETGFMEEEATGFMDISNTLCSDTLEIKVLEEQSSL